MSVEQTRESPFSSRNVAESGWACRSYPRKSFPLTEIPVSSRNLTNLRDGLHAFSVYPYRLKEYDAWYLIDLDEMTAASFLDSRFNCG